PGHGEQAVDAVGRGGHVHPGRPGQPVGCRVDAHHGGHLEAIRQPQHLDHQIRADVARADHGDLHRAPPNRADTSPSPASSARKWSPAATGTIGPSAPDNTIWPARNGSPKSRAVRANQANAAIGSPRHAAPSPSDTSSSPRYRRIRTSLGSSSANVFLVSASTNSPLEALSAMVSVIEMSQPAMRLST